jgi:hypothetical protein
VTLRQIHSDRVWNAQGLLDREQEGDALVTNEVGRAIGVRTADCVPILLLDVRLRSVAAVHAGWRGTADEIVRHALRRMTELFGSQPAHVYAAIGPSIRECCYEVGAEVAGRFESWFPEWKPPAGRRFLDLAEANRRQLLSAGVERERIFDSTLCTVCEASHFYSYRREPHVPHRMVSSICRVD